MVLKFGGTSVASRAGWQTIAGRCDAILGEGCRAVVVCSALATVSDRLEQLLDLAASGKAYAVPLKAIRQLHGALAAELHIDLPETVREALAELGTSLESIRLVGEASPRIRARVMSLGERMSTRLGAAWLKQQGMPAAWTDARDMLTAVAEPAAPEERRFLSAWVDAAEDISVRKRLPETSVVITQGFIASNVDGETVLLGRGGSDTSAAYLGVLLAAERVEIWTDVPGLFSADPRGVTGARHLTALGYDEAAAMAALGASVLHPRCVGVAGQGGVPLHVRSTYLPEERGTVVDEGDGSTGIKAVTARDGLYLLRMRRPSRWQPVGFVADVASCFKRAGLSMDLLATSPSTLSVTVDPSCAPGMPLYELVAELRKVCDATLEGPVASVSLVGTGVREAFDRLGPALGELEGVDIEMVVQGAADHHLTFVVPEAAADALVTRLHACLVASDLFGTLALPSFDPLEIGASRRASA